MIKSIEDKFYGWTALAAAAMVYFFICGLLIYPFGIFLPVLCDKFGWSRGAVSGAYTLQFSVWNLLGPLAAVVITRIGPRMSIILGNILCALGLLLLAFLWHLWQFYVGYGLILGLGISIAGFLATTTIANNWFDKKRSLALGIVLAAGGIGGLILVPVLGKVLETVGWRGTFLLMPAVLVLFSAILPGLIIRNKPEDLGQVPDGGSPSPSPKSSSTAHTGRLYVTPVDFRVDEALKTRAYWLLILYSTSFLFPAFMVIAHEFAFLTDMGISTGVAATALGLIPGASIVGKLGIGFFSLRYNMRSLAVMANVLMTVGMGLFLVTRSVPMVFISTTCFGVGYGAGLMAMTGLIPVYFGMTHYTILMGFTSAFTVLGFFGAPFAGAIYDVTGSYTMPFIIGLICLVASVACLAFATPPKHPLIKEV